MVRVRADGRIEYTRIDASPEELPLSPVRFARGMAAGKVDDRSALDGPGGAEPYPWPTPGLTPVRYCPVAGVRSVPITPFLYCLSRRLPAV